MQVDVLGAVVVWADSGEPVPLRGDRMRGLLARLALDAGRAVTADALVDGLWGANPPDAAANALQALVSRLRRAIGAHHVETAARGYRLVVDPDHVDALRFDAMLTAATAADAQARPEDARALIGQALGLWRGPALADVRELPFAGTVAERFTERRAVAIEQRARIVLRTGHAGPDELTAELDALAAQLAATPLREPSAALLARTLHAAGRQADALAVVDRTRARLAEELGVDPGPELAAARQAVLRGPGASGAPEGSGHAAGTATATGAATATAPWADGFNGALPPGAVDSFVGRAGDVTRVRELLARGRLVTLTGPGGAGKTRLAREATAVQSGNGSAPAETRLVELAPLSDPAQLPAALLTAVGAAELQLRRSGNTEAPEHDRLRAALADRELVLVLDNCEHLVDAVAVLTHDLLAAAPRLRVLATSREPLGVPGEALHPVGSLAPDDAERLFADRAAAVRPGFTVTAGIRPSVTEICRRLDGQPLPIELAAARLPTLSPAEIASRLDDRFRLLTGGARTALPRHQTLRAVVDWSWDLLDKPERALAQRLAVFAGGATLAALERVGPAADGPAAADTLDLLGALVDKSLVQAVPQPDGVPTRYRMLETIRDYAAEHLLAAGEHDAVAAAHSAYFLELAEFAEPHLRGAAQLSWLERLRVENGNLDAVLHRAVAARDAATAQRMVAALSWSWIIRGLVDETVTWLPDSLALPGPVPPAVHALVAAFLAWADAGRGDMVAARTHVDIALTLATGVVGPRHPVLDLVGPVLALFVDEDEEPIAGLTREHPDPWVRACALTSYAMVAENVGDVDTQRGRVRAAHALFAELGDRFGLGVTLHSLGELEDVAGDLDAAAAAYDQAVALATELGNGDELPQFVARRARLDVRRGDFAQAHRRLDTAFALARPSGVTRDVLHMTLAETHRREGRPEAARAALALVGDLPVGGPGDSQRRAFRATCTAAVELAAGGVADAAGPLGVAVAAAMESRDGPVAAAVAELAARVRLVAGDPLGAAQLLGVAIAQRGTLDRGDPEVRAVLAAVEDTLGPVAAGEAIRRGRELPREAGLELLVELSGAIG